MLFWKIVLIMCAVSAIKLFYKGALSSGRIYQQTWLAHDLIVQHLAGKTTPYTDLTAFSVALTEQQWINFQTAERAFRKMIDTKKLQEKQHFMSSGDPGQ